MSISENLATVSERVDAAVKRRSAGSSGAGTNVKIVAVTKNQDIAAMREVIDAGAMTIGENRVQEAQGKIGLLDRSVDWHLIGHLQTNKARQAVSLFSLIHSVDSSRLAVAINEAAAREGKRQGILIQVNVADEETKFGLEPSEMPGLAREVAGLEHLRLCGLMTIAPFYEDAEQVRPVFREMYRLFMELKSMELPNTNIEWLSMGMTNDYDVAVEEGANIVRVGTAIFGPRHY